MRLVCKFSLVIPIHQGLPLEACKECFCVGQGTQICESWGNIPTDQGCLTEYNTEDTGSGYRVKNSVFAAWKWILLSFSWLLTDVSYIRYKETS